MTGEIPKELEPLYTININYAYSGFLYSPLFIAKKLGLLPDCASLVPRGGDSECLKALCGPENGKEKNWFAVCDPFSDPELAYKIHSAGDKLLVVGCMIDKLPFWVYSNSKDTHRVNQETEMAEFAPEISKILCYKKDTTGELIGIRLRKELQVSDDNLKRTEFDCEFDGSPDEYTAILTSDLLRAWEAEDDLSNWIFNYTAFSPEGLKPFLFTGILTRESVVRENLWAVLSVLAGIKQAVHQLATHPETYAKFLADKFNKQLTEMGATTQVQKIERISNALTFATTRMSLYSTSLAPSKLAWDNAEKEWRKVHPKRNISAVMKDYPIPSLLLVDTWEKDPVLRFHLNRLIPNPVTAVKAGVLKMQDFAMMLGIFFLPLLLSFLFAQSVHTMGKSLLENIGFIVVALIALSASYGSAIALIRDLRNMVTNRIGIYFGGTCVVALAFVIDAIAGIK